MILYYIIHIPIQADIDFIYTSHTEIAEGCRIVVNFNRKDIIGICGKLVSTPNTSKLRYKAVLEIIDSNPVLSPELLQLGAWMAAYYQCPLAKTLYAMLPSILLPEVTNTAMWIGPETNYPPEFQVLYEALQDGAKHSLQDLRKELKGQPLYRLLEEAEAQNLIEIVRSHKHKVKPKTQNFVETIVPKPSAQNLTQKQEDAYLLISGHAVAVPLAEISDSFSYAIIKALVKKGMVRIFPRQVQSRSMMLPEIVHKKAIVLTEEQNTVIAELMTSFNSFRKHLLFGITGSGKTEIYIEIIKRYLTIGKGVLFLIPEIALTPQMVERFYSVFGENLAIMHSQLSDRERFEEWRKISSGKCRIVIGARSAIFAPMQNIGLIIVDEEHEQSYKQDQSPRYNGRDIAIVRAKYTAAQVILGSATPSLESWSNALGGNYLIHTLKNRPLSYLLPQVELIDMRDEASRDLMSPTLKDAISETLERKEQVILFQNRRGYSSFVQCLKCGELLKCVNCEVSMYYHRDREELNCHYCGVVIPVPRRCNKCGSYSFSYGAAGTQKIEQLLQIYFPTARILRLDSDSAAKKDMYRFMYERMKKREVDILLGTQMISKGLDFPGVTLVGVISADISLNVPDFRAAERTFQLLTQVAGRSGRGEASGRVLIQSFNVDHYAIRHASRQDYESFATEELSYRKRLYYPPHFRLGRIVFQSKDLVLLDAEMLKLAQLSTRLLSLHPLPELIVLGPAPAPNAKVNNLFRYHLILKAVNPRVLSAAINFLKMNFKTSSALSSYIDIDPMMLM